MSVEFSEVAIGLLQFILPVVSSVLVVVLTALAKKWLDKLGVERSVKIDDMIDRYVDIGVKYAERVAVKKLDGHDSMTGVDKRNLAITTVLAELEQSGIKGVTEQLIKARIEKLLQDKEIANA